MFDHILVPLDGSQLAECVLPHTLTVAHAFDAEITLLRILEKNQAGISTQFFDSLNCQINKTKALLYLETIQTRFQTSGIRAETTVLEGLVAEGITEYAQNQRAKAHPTFPSWAAAAQAATSSPIHPMHRRS